VRGTTFYMGGSWAWLCAVCATSEGGFAEEHHARTLVELHTDAHRPDLDGGAQLAPPAPPAPVEISPAVIEHRQAVARAVLARATKEPTCRPCT